RAGTAGGAQRGVRPMGGGEPGSQPGDPDDHGAQPGVAGGALESLAKIEERRTATAAELVEWRARRALAHRARQLDDQHGVVRNPRQPHDQQPESRGDRARDDEQAEAGLTQAVVDGERAGSGHQRDEYCGPDLAPQRTDRYPHLRLLIFGSFTLGPSVLLN